MDDDQLTEELLQILRSPGMIIDLLRRAYELGYAAGLQDDTMKEMLG